MDNIQIASNFNFVNKLSTNLIGPDLVKTMPDHTDEDDLDYSTGWEGIKTDLRFIDICNTILYSNDKEAVARAYNELFSTYRFRLLASDRLISKSCFEDVISKTLNDAIDQDAYSMHGERYAPFIKLITLIRDISIIRKHSPFAISLTAGTLRGTFNKKEPSYSYIDIKKCLLGYVGTSDMMTEQILFLLKKHIIDFKK